MLALAVPDDDIPTVVGNNRFRSRSVGARWVPFLFFFSAAFGAVGGMEEPLRQGNLSNVAPIHLYGDIQHVLAIADGLQVRAMCEGWLAGAALVNDCGDLLPFPTTKKIAAFCTLDGGIERYKTGSYTEVRGPSSIAGLSFGLGPVALGGFVECAHGAVRTKDDEKAGGAEFRGKGKSTAVGGGILARANVRLPNFNLFFCEFAGRAGSVHNAWDGDDTDSGIVYDRSEPYLGVRTGVGFRVDFRQKCSVELYGNYLWAHLTKEENVAGGLVSFGSLESHRLQLGWQADCWATEKLTPWCGAYLEHEFAGTVDGVASGADISNQPSLKGSSVACKLGLSYRPFSAVGMDLALRAVAGHRSGLGLSFQIDGKF
ncbi:MAG: hypothetical protein LBF24_01225 [Puniceicoccales bacterium]|jgi:hypothetical protein|nr:hypothetical protein [Puniceicoccales bacterium]